MELIQVSVSKVSKDAPVSEVIDAGRGTWRTNPARAAQAQYVVYAVRGVVKAVTKLTSLTEQERADGNLGVVFEGPRAAKNDPVCKALLGQRAPCRSYGNPISYFSLETGKASK